MPPKGKKKAPAPAPAPVVTETPTPSDTSASEPPPPPPPKEKRKSKTQKPRTSIVPEVVEEKRKSIVPEARRKSVDEKAKEKRKSKVVEESITTITSSDVVIPTPAPVAAAPVPAGEPKLIMITTPAPPPGVPTVCDHCKAVVTPIQDRYPSKLAHIIALVLFIIGLPFLIFIPYFLDVLGTPVARCPECNEFINTYPS